MLVLAEDEELEIGKTKWEKREEWLKAAAPMVENSKTGPRWTPSKLARPEGLTEIHLIGWSFYDLRSATLGVWRGVVDWMRENAPAPSTPEADCGRDPALLASEPPGDV
jgi:hypothetical protein